VPKISRPVFLPIADVRAAAMARGLSIKEVERRAGWARGRLAMALRRCTGGSLVVRPECAADLVRVLGPIPCAEVPEWALADRVVLGWHMHAHGGARARNVAAVASTLARALKGAPDVE
jgi:hypothetical protein